LRRVFETVVRRSMEEGLVGGEGFAVDGIDLRRLSAGTCASSEKS
jgi:hypothetical protein